jgi:hypothetical protein
MGGGNAVSLFTKDVEAEINASRSITIESLGHRVDHGIRGPGRFRAKVRSRGYRAAVHPVVNNSLSCSCVDAVDNNSAYRNVASKMREAIT